MAMTGYDDGKILCGGGSRENIPDVAVTKERAPWCPLLEVQNA
jgi:hypothetical protein